VKNGSIPKRFGENFEEKVRIAEEITKEVVKIPKDVFDFNESLDEVFMDKHLGIPIFLSFMWMVFVFTYSVANPIVDFLDGLFDLLSESISSNDNWVFSLLGDGVVKGVGSVLVFLPNITFLFIALSLLELSGYMPRAVYLMDSFMSKFGLNGRSIIPLIIGFGCNVPSVMATRSIEDEKIRLTTILIAPFMSCSVRLSIYVLFTAVFFPKNGSVVVMSLYLTGVIVAFMSALLFRKFLLKGDADYILELPPYRIPNPKEIWILTWSRVKHFLEKAGTVILAMSIVIWFITNYPSAGVNSYAGMIGKALQPVFSPMGWDWKLVLALVMGFVAKEIVVETIGILGIPLKDVLTPVQALSFMLFTLLYIPCLATLTTIRSETNTKWCLFAVFYSFSVAYLVSLLVLEVGSWLV
jgi:ferrous iron transport protein B